jgi:hypothetical protein
MAPVIIEPVVWLIRAPSGVGMARQNCKEPTLVILA